jgi:hypothetical protein
MKDMRKDMKEEMTEKSETIEVEVEPEDTEIISS